MVKYFNFIVACLINLCKTNALDHVHFGQKVEVQTSNGTDVDAILDYHLELDLSSCIYQCKLRRNCRFINYRGLFLQCFLIRIVQTTETVNILINPGYLYADKNDWSLTAVCSGCGDGETCDLSYGTWHCSIKECGSPPVFLDSVVNGNMRTVGSVIKYTCTQYKTMIVHTTYSSECLENGLWSATNFECLDIDECLSSPCGNYGTCVDGVNGYTCSCESGWEGEHCEIDTDECQVPHCLNGGTCTDAVNGFTCTCGVGWKGPTCESTNECASDPCLNGGTCSDGPNAFTCQCNNGWTGNTCELDVNDCANDPCENGGQCVDGVGEYTCSCTSSWTGDHCQTAQCSPGWSLYMLSCYKLNAYRKTFSDAKSVCQQAGGHLADVSSSTEMDFLKGLYLESFTVSDIDGIWVSTNDIDNEGVWRLSDNTIAGFTNWHLPGQPDNEFYYDDCVQVWPNVDFYWNDVNCGFSLWFFCEYEL